MDNIIYCISSPCCYQEPKVVLTPIDKGQYECPACGLTYPIEFVVDAPQFANVKLDLK